MSESAKTTSSVVVLRRPAIMALILPVRPAGGWPQMMVSASVGTPAARRSAIACRTSGSAGSSSSSKTKKVRTRPG